MRTDLPDDYIALCKASFTAAPLIKLERLGHHVPEIDSLNPLCDAYENGTLKGVCRRSISDQVFISCL